MNEIKSVKQKNKFEDTKINRKIKKRIKMAQKQLIRIKRSQLDQIQKN